MNIITIGSDTNLFKQGSRVYNRVREYAKLVQTYTVFVFTKNENDKNIIDGNFKIIAVYDSNKLLQVLRLFVLLKKGRFRFVSDVMISSQDPFEIGLISYIASKIIHAKLHIQIHIDFFSEFFKRESIRQFIQYLLARYFIIRRSGSIRVVSEKIRSYLIDEMKISENKIMVIPVIVGDSLSRSDIKKENIIVSICRLVKQKNIDRLIDAFEILSKKHSDLALHIYGSGEEEKRLRTRIDYSSVKDKIKLMGWVDSPLEVMTKAKVFAISSNYEGWAMTAIESVKANTPVVMTPVGCANEFIINCINGFVSPDFSSESFAISLERALLFTFEPIVLKKSLNSLLSNEEYNNRILLSWQKAV